MAESKMSLKLLVDSKSNKVLFAEAGKDFVDFLFNLFALPVGTVVWLLTKSNMVGCLGNLYGSIENLSETYMQPNQDKDSLLKPRVAISASASNVPLMLAPTESQTMKVYMCRSYHPNVSDNPSLTCPQCDRLMKTEVPFVVARRTEAKTTDGGGYVQGVVTYMVMDDLTVSPMSTISSITLLNKFNVKEVGALQEKVVTLGMNEGLELLKLSLQSKSVLTNVFLGKTRTYEDAIATSKPVKF